MEAVPSPRAGGRRRGDRLRRQRGGTELKLDLVLMVPPEQGLRVRRKASLTVDGDVAVILELEDGAEPVSLRVSAQAVGA